MLRPGRTCWRIARADRLALLVDAADYFAAAKAAMIAARRSIVLIGWDFDLRIPLTRGSDAADAPDGEPPWPDTLGAFLKTVVRRRPELDIFLLKWDVALLYTLARQVLPLAALDLIARGRTHLRFDSRHPWTAAHHQKIAVIDGCFAFCGGIDMTAGRWDTREHRSGDRRRFWPGGGLHTPWPAATLAVDGKAARALGELARERWRLATGETLPPLEPDGRSGGDVWPPSLVPQLRDVPVGIARTMPPFDGRDGVREVEALALAAIRSARTSIYLESQYFASAKLCGALAERLREPDGPEVIVINPLSTRGWLEQETMGTARDLCLQDIDQADRHRRFRILHPVTAAGEPIYVHAKILVVDDRLLRVGSSNVNNRSMGFDTECDLAVEASRPADRTAIRRMRDGLLAEHLGVPVAAVERAVAEHGSLRAAIDALRRRSGRSLRPIPVRPNEPWEEALVRSRAADPERPSDPEGRIVHALKRIALPVPPSAWLALALGFGLGFVAGRRLAPPRNTVRRRTRRETRAMWLG